MCVMNLFPMLPTMPLSETAWRVYKVIFWVDCTQRLQNTYCKGADDFWFWKSNFPAFVNALLIVERKQDKRPTQTKQNYRTKNGGYTHAHLPCDYQRGLTYFCFFAPLLVRAPGTAVALTWSSLYLQGFYHKCSRLSDELKLLSGAKLYLVGSKRGMSSPVWVQQ